MDNNVDVYVSEEESYEASLEGEEEHLFLFKFVNHSGKNKSGLEILKMDQEEEKIFLASISYVQVLKLAVKCREICQAWQVRRDKRIMSDQEIEINLEMVNALRHLGCTTSLHYRVVKDYSVYRLIEVLGDEPEVEKFIKEISTSVNLLKSAMFMIVRSCLPPMISSISPVVSRVLEFSIADENLNNIGLVSQGRSRQLVEVKYLMNLYEYLGSVYNCMREMMFLTYPQEENIIDKHHRHIFRAQVHVMGTLLEEEDGGWVSNSSWEEDVVKINSDTDIARKMFGLSTCIFN